MPVAYRPTTAWLLLAATLVVDQVSKAWVLYGLRLDDVQNIALLPFFHLTMVWNRGIAMTLPTFGLGAIGLSLLTAVITLWLARWLWRSKRPTERLALALVIGGAAGNLIDRLVYGAVVDFLHFFYADWHFYVFNMADSAITVGAALLVWDGFFGAEGGGGAALGKSTPPTTPPTTPQDTASEG